MDGEADDLVRALEAGGMEADLRRSIPTESDLLTYDAVVLVNVDQPGTEDSENLAAFVEELGRGLVVIGGDRAYGLGDYHQTPLEAVLPVSSNPDDLVRRQPVAEVLVIDSSGSMGACHCNMGTAVEGGVVKTDIARAGAELAIEALTDRDRVGVLTFTSGTDWVIPLAPRSTITDAAGALSGITANGDTEISNALEVALAELAGAPEELRHIVLFTDGWDPSDANLLPIAREIADAGVTLSVLGTGEGPGNDARADGRAGWRPLLSGHRSRIDSRDLRRGDPDRRSQPCHGGDVLPGAALTFTGHRGSHQLAAACSAMSSPRRREAHRS